jgi:hypothetical protein
VIRFQQISHVEQSLAHGTQYARLVVGGSKLLFTHCFNTFRLRRLPQGVGMHCLCSPASARSLHLERCGGSTTTLVPRPFSTYTQQLQQRKRSQRGDRQTRGPRQGVCSHRAHVMFDGCEHLAAWDHTGQHCCDIDCSCETNSNANWMCYWFHSVNE